ncbi:hypothetical protein [Paraburkholderia phenoliruptrix]|uniref:hypothetical protein n=1 Tax=Paraburkholderia phenoliruptrix TaxID=252970 RepID=UPI0034CFB8DF
MKTTIIAALFATAALSACGSQRIVQDKEIGYMSRQEVSAAIEDCESAGQRATVVYAKAEWRDKLVPVPVDVQCLPGRGSLANLSKLN